MSGRSRQLMYAFVLFLLAFVQGVDAFETIFPRELTGQWQSLEDSADIVTFEKHEILAQQTDSVCDVIQVSKSDRNALKIKARCKHENRQRNMIEISVRTFAKGQIEIKWYSNGPWIKYKLDPAK